MCVCVRKSTGIARSIVIILTFEFHKDNCLVSCGLENSIYNYQEIHWHLLLWPSSQSCLSLTFIQHDKPAYFLTPRASLLALSLMVLSILSLALRIRNTESAIRIFTWLALVKGMLTETESSSHVWHFFTFPENRYDTPKLRAGSTQHP